MDRWLKLTDYTYIEVRFLLLFRFRFGFQFQFPFPLRFAAHWCNKSQDNLATIIMGPFVIWLRRLLWLLQGLIHTHTHTDTDTYSHSLWPTNCINSAPSGVGVYRVHRKDAISIFDLSCAPNCRVMWATFSRHRHDNLMRTCLFAIWILVWVRVQAWMRLWVSFIHKWMQ